MAGLERVYVAGHVETYHATAYCDGLIASLQRTSAVILWCWAAAAHRSRLVPCASCAARLTAALRDELGSVPSGARRSMGLPALEALTAALRGRSPSPAQRADQHRAAGVLPSATATLRVGADARSRAAEIEDLLNRALATAHADLETAGAGWAADPAAC